MSEAARGSVTLPGLESIRQFAARSIEANEKLAKELLRLQETATGWAKGTFMARFFEAQHSIGKDLIERSAAGARKLWGI